MAEVPQGGHEKKQREGARQRATPRDKTLHFRIETQTAEALEVAAAANQRSVSAWVAICVTNKLREEGWLS